TQVMDRQSIGDAFNTGTSKACLLSTRAGRRVVVKGFNVNEMAKWKLVLAAAVLENNGGDLIITHD
ncbi:hypothetical protein OIU85_005840, partial [Salix viminalis]